MPNASSEKSYGRAPQSNRTARYDWVLRITLRTTERKRGATQFAGLDPQCLRLSSGPSFSLRQIGKGPGRERAIGSLTIAVDFDAKRLGDGHEQMIVRTCSVRAIP